MPDPEYIDDYANTAKPKKKKRRSKADSEAFSSRWAKPTKPYASRGRQMQIDELEGTLPSSPKRRKKP